MLVETGETLKGRLDVFGGDAPHVLRFELADEPPVAVGVGITPDNASLPLDGRGEAVEGVDQVEK